MKHNHRIRDMVAGGVLTALVLSMATPAMAALQSMTIEAYTGLKVYVNDQLVEPKDANGNPVEVLVYNGITYLPIRAVGAALGLPVQYDGATQSAYIGKHNSETPAVYLDELDYFSGTSADFFTTKATESDNLNQGHSHCIANSFDRTYKLNGQYTTLTGNLYQNYEDRSATIYSGSGLWIYGDGKLLYAKEFNEHTTGFEPEVINIDLTGVLELNIKFVNRNYSISGSSHPNYAARGSEYDTLSLGEMALYT